MKSIVSIVLLLFSLNVSGMRKSDSVTKGEDGSIEHCAITSNQQAGLICSKCDTDYTLADNNHKCVYNPYCHEGMESGFYCTVCEENYSANYTTGDEFICTYDPQCIAHDHDYLGKKYCSKCNAEYAVDQTTLLCVSSPHCTGQNSKGVCNKCSYGFAVDQTTHECTESAHCTNQDEYGVCNECDVGFMVDASSKKCVLDYTCIYSRKYNECGQCIEGYSMNKTTNSCIPNPHCTKFHYLDNYCTGCAAGYALDKSTTLCEIGYWCDIRSDNGTCIKCKTYVSSGSMTMNPLTNECMLNNHCSSNTGSKDNTCTQCSFGSSLSTNKYTLNPLNHLCYYNNNCSGLTINGVCSNIHSSMMVVMYVKRINIVLE